MLPFALAFLSTVLLMPVAIRLAPRFRMVDRPDHRLKTHEKPIPQVGGIAIGLVMFAVLAVLHGAALFDSANLGLLAGAAIVAAGGLLDDRLKLRPLAKLGFQAAAGVCIWSFGVGTHYFGWPALDWTLSMLWLVGVINAVNLIDIMDGLAAGVAGIAALFLSVLLGAKGDFFYSAALLGAAGACAGFLRYNFKPAKAYLGDAGSQLLGYVLACSALRWGMNESVGGHLLVPVVALGIPLFETALVSVLRLKQGRSPFIGSKDHFALRMVKLGYSVRTTVLLAYAAAVGLGLASVWMLYFDAVAYYAAAALAAVMLPVGCKLGRVDMGTSREGAGRWRRSC